MATKKKTEEQSSYLVVTQTGSPIGRRADQRATLIGLGLNKIGRSRRVLDNASVRGQINKVAHLIAVTQAEA
jgi:large subunit ribosomal protein L30